MVNIEGIELPSTEEELMLCAIADLEKLHHSIISAYDRLSVPKSSINEENFVSVIALLIKVPNSGFSAEVYELVWTTQIRVRCKGYPGAMGFWSNHPAHRPIFEAMGLK